MKLSTALKIAWRESRASGAKFAFVILAVAVGVGSLSGVRGFSRAFRTLLLRDARTLMAGDLSVRDFDMPTAAQSASLAAIEKRGVGVTWITETVSMMGSAKVAEPVLVAVKAVEPGVYPFYGEVKLRPASPLATTLD
ncbi:MAG: ABC transporter permease, partial [Bryobacteraceae bacterium]